MYTLLCIQVHFSISHPIQRICPSYLMLVNSTCGLFHHFPHFFSQSLLDEPNPNSPANSQAAQLYQENKREYEKRVTAIVEQSWVDVWASQPLYYFLSIPPSSSQYFSLSFLPRQGRKKHSNFIRRTQVPPWKKKEDWNNQTRMDINLLANTFKENQGGEINLIFVFLFFNAWCEISYC